MKIVSAILFAHFCLFLLPSITFGQGFVFPFSSNGNRVCLVESEVDLIVPKVTIKLLDHTSNTNHTTSIYRRPLYGTGNDWNIVVSSLPAGTTQWVDNNVLLGEVWEYQIKRQNTWPYNSQMYDAIGYTIGSLEKDNTNYQGQLILLIADNISNNLSNKILRLKSELTGNGWFVNEIIVPRANGWNCGDTVIGIRNQIASIYTNAPANDKPKMLFILGHVPMPRSGSTFVTAPDGHDQSKGARGFDGYYADIDGVYTDTATFNPGSLQTNLLINLPGDFKWDQDFFSSDIEMAFGRVDFADLTEITGSEITLMENYLDRLSKYKNVDIGFDMGEKSAFKYGYQNSNDGSYRTLPNLTKAANVIENTTSSNHPQWVQNNGPFKIYMQNQILPEISDWQTYGMNATVYSSDQSYWGYNDVPQTGVYSRIRGLLGMNTKCLVTLWTTSAINIFHQACTGDALGMAMKQIMGHSLSNNRLQKPPQQWDTDDWWNRTHMSYNGDPSISLYQVIPATNLTISPLNGGSNLTWTFSTDTSVLGYHVFKSSTEFGKYQRITTSPISSNSYNDLTYQTNDWYMVRAVARIESGCGKFLHGSLGIFTQGTFSTANISEIESSKDFHLFPNPNAGTFTIEYHNLTIEPIEITILSIDGKEMFHQTILQGNDLNEGNSVRIKTRLNSGQYIVILKTNRTVLQKKIIIQ